MIDPNNFSELKFCKSIERDAFFQEINSNLFHPIGIRGDVLEPTEVYYIPVDEETVDLQWFAARFPQSIGPLSKIVKEAFEQYCGEDWCGADAREEVLEALEDEGADAVRAFEQDGYLPFFEIQAIYLCREADTVVLDGAAVVDGNLDEHGVEISISSAGTKFGYGADFDELYFSEE